MYSYHKLVSNFPTSSYSCFIWRVYVYLKLSWIHGPVHYLLLFTLIWNTKNWAQNWRRHTFAEVDQWCNSGLVISLAPNCMEPNFEFDEFDNINSFIKLSWKFYRFPCKLDFPYFNDTNGDMEFHGTARIVEIWKLKVNSMELPGASKLSNSMIQEILCYFLSDDKRIIPNLCL